MRGKKAKGDDDLPEDILKLVGEDGPRIMTQLINSIHQSGDRPKDFTEVMVIALKKKPGTTKCSNYGTYSKDSSEDT